MLDAEAVAKGKQTDLDDKGIAKNAREEKLRARDEMKKKAEDDRMARLYRQHVLKEPKPQEVSGLQIQGLKKPAAPSDDKTEPRHDALSPATAERLRSRFAPRTERPSPEARCPPGFFVLTATAR